MESAKQREKIETKVNIINIQRFSVHDGDGIRTTVFFAGCPLRCLWCHNPESYTSEPSLLYFKEKCTGCGACVVACKNGAITIGPDGESSTSGGTYKSMQNFNACRVCGDCVAVCPSGARQLSSKPYSADELVDICIKDRMFYEESGGGVTLSGGEVMMQDTEFLLYLLKKLTGHGLSVFIDTSGYAPWEKFEAVMPYTDVFLYDIKSADSEKHKCYTGVGNEVIIENLHKLSDAGARIYLRVPVISPSTSNDDGFDGVNYTDEDIEGIIKLLPGLKIEKIYLLPYHNTGSYKRSALGLQNDERFAVPDRERLLEIKQMLESVVAKNNTKGDYEVVLNG